MIEELSVEKETLDICPEYKAIRDSDLFTFRQKQRNEFCIFAIMIKENNMINNLSKHLFWDVDLSAIDQEKNSKYIISKVIQYGLFTDWKQILAFYGTEKITNTARQIKSLDKKTASFIALLTNTPKKSFLCYTTEQSIPKHWNF